MENNFTQEKISGIVGLSKKTLIEIEKGRSSLTWAGAVCIATIFEHSEVIQTTFGGDKIQQNIISQHHRILDKENHRICCSFELDEIELRFKEIANN
ncbi:helix-turn-helix domain-containing protein [Viridibacillus arvi]|uniref:hypothetical protein n=1 Tax=Viridibacillus arvi TaxID=263475 RepID=UPI0009FB7456|nr:hypothetical protein [Viridibacillus arvi]